MATFNSLSIQASCLHPLEALHGDLGIINDNHDCLIMLTASGNTPELINLLPHLSCNLPIILLTCNKFSNLSTSNRILSLLLADLPNSHNEEMIHGLPAPTVSTTLSLILADSVILSLSELIEQDLVKRKKLFGLKHPGGSIGAYLNLDTGSSLTSDGSTTSLLSLKNDQQQTTSSTRSSKASSAGTTSSSANTTTITSVASPSSDTKTNHALPITISKTSSISSDGQGLEIYATPSHHYCNNNNNTTTTTTTTTTSTRTKYISHDEIINIEELTILKWITLFDSLQISQTELKVDIMQVRQLYRQYRSDGDGDDDASQEAELNWNKFKWELLRSFN